MASAETKLANLMDRITGDEVLKAAFDADQAGWNKVVNGSIGSARSKTQVSRKSQFAHFFPLTTARLDSSSTMM